MDVRTEKLEIGLLLRDIGLACDDNTYKKVKPFVDKLEDKLVNLFNEIESGEKNA